MLDLLAPGAGMIGVLLVAITIYLFYKNRRVKKIKAALKVLIVDDDESSVLSLVSILSGLATDICIADSADSMLKELKEGSFDVLFVDRMMPIQNGDVALAIADQQSTSGVLPVVIFTGNEQGLIIPKLSRFKVVGVWNKHVGYQTLEAKVNAMLDELVIA